LPQLLRSGAIERVRASQDALALALFGMARPETTGAALPRANAGEIGLVGSSAELALSACLFQIGGPRAVAKRDGRYPSAPEALAEFRRVIRARPPRVSALVDGVDDRTTIWISSLLRRSGSPRCSPNELAAYTQGGGTQEPLST